MTNRLETKAYIWMIERTTGHKSHSRPFISARDSVAVHILVKDIKSQRQ